MIGTALHILTSRTKSLLLKILIKPVCLHLCKANFQLAACIYYGGVITSELVFVKSWNIGRWGLMGEVVLLS